MLLPAERWECVAHESLLDSMCTALASHNCKINTWWKTTHHYGADMVAETDLFIPNRRPAVGIHHIAVQNSTEKRLSMCVYVGIGKSERGRTEWFLPSNRMLIGRHTGGTVSKIDKRLDALVSAIIKNSGRIESRMLSMQQRPLTPITTMKLLTDAHNKHILSWEGVRRIQSATLMSENLTKLSLAIEFARDQYRGDKPSLRRAKNTLAFWRLLTE